MEKIMRAKENEKIKCKESVKKRNGKGKKKKDCKRVKESNLYIYDFR